MNKVELHVVPTDPSVPYPMTLERIRATLALAGLASQPLGPDEILALIDGQVFTFCLSSSAKSLSVRATWDTGREYELVEERLFAAADTWNRERYFPTVYARANEHGFAQVVADHLTPCRRGLSDRQLDDTIQVGISTGRDAINFMQDAASSVLGMLDDSSRS